MKRIGLALMGVVAAAAAASVVRAQTPTYDDPPIQYSSSHPHDPVARLAQRIKAGQVKLDYSPAHGYLESLLRELKIPVSSQTLVFSKTSFQRDLITPQNPRALYFDDDTYVGYVPGGEVIEVATTDPALGTIFYTVDQRPPKEQGAAAVRLHRQTDNCLSCHSGSMTRDVPGLLMRSVYPDARGMPILSAGTFVTTQDSPLKERWGGWYISGFDADGHLGNTLFQEQEGSDPQPAGATQLKDASKYLAPRSDAVALLVLAHQTEAHNRFTRAAYATARALRDEKVLSDALGETPKPGEHSDSTLARVKSACDPLVEYLLFADEPALPAAVRADSPFAADFSARGPRDARGRSLRDFDLKKRLFRYPCSYLIYSSSFDQFPEVAKDYLYRRIFDVLVGKETGKPFSHLSAADRQAILEILCASKKGLPAYWTKSRAS
jgi:hypothetical protein